MKIQNMIAIYEHNSDVKPVLLVKLSDMVIATDWKEKNVLGGKLDNVYVENGIIHIEYTLYNGERWAETFPPESKLIFELKEVA